MKFPQSLHLIDAFKNSDDYKLIKGIESIRSTYKIFHGNYCELKSTLSEHEEKSNDGSMWNDNYLRWELQDKLVRRLYNFLSSAATLVDHTRKHNRKLYHPTEPIAIEYHNKINQDFKQSPLCCFIGYFRNFLSHDKLPSIVSTRRGRGTTAITSFKIKKSSLEDGEWKSLARNFLEQLPDNFEVEVIVDEYYRKVKNLHEWYKFRQLQLNKDTYAKVISEKKTLLKLATEDRIPHALPFSQLDIDQEELFLQSL